MTDLPAALQELAGRQFGHADGVAVARTEVQALAADRAPVNHII
jgi:hypothetical protein